MKDIKKLMITLVALLAVTAGAWAQTETLLTTIESTANTDFTSGSKSFDGVATVTFSQSVNNDGDGWGWFRGNETTITVTAANNDVTITKVKFYCSEGSAFDEEAPFEAIVKYEVSDNIAIVNGTSIGRYGVTKIEVYGYAPASSGPEVAWNKAEKTGSFTMPGGNVELEPEYYPQAVLATGGAPTAINDVPATTDGAIVNAGTVANIGGTTNAQGTVMYYVSTTTLDDAALLALAADAWTADVPTAESFTAAGQAHVYYYVRGNDGDTDDEIFSDGDILSANKLTVTIAAAPTYAVTFAEGTDPNEWTASPNANVTKGETVTVTYTGTKKVLGVKAEKKAGAAKPALSINIGDASIHYNEGESWKDAIQKYPTENAGWSIDGNTVKYNGNYTLCYDDWSGSAVFPQETIDAESDYKLVTVN